MKGVAIGVGVVLAACATAPPSASDVDAVDVDAVVRSLSLEQKAGQLFFVWSLARRDGANHDELLARLADADLGGVILSLGTVDDAAALVPRLQAASDLPLLLAGDFEGGVWFRLRGAAELGNQMLVGATGSAALAEAMGRVTGQEAKALGFHVVFAPVLDVNSNPDNPIVNVRSFGEDPAQVARLGAAFARGVQSQGLLACGKHFPGHGDVATDSHLALPTVPGAGERLRQVELRPFAAAARDGLAAVMTGHLAVPGLGEDPAVPATLSPRILGDVLRRELGFGGLIVTDALDMGGVKGALPPGEVAVRALLAGADVLLMPPEPLVARAAVVDAVRSGRVPLARLDEAVRRIVAAKADVGLFAGRGRVLDDWRSRVRSDDGERLADAIAARGITLVRDRGGALPLTAAAGPVLLVVLADRDEGQGRALAAGLAGVLDPDAVVRLSGASSDADVAAAVGRVAGASTVVLAFDVRVRENRGTLGLPAHLQPLVDALRADQRVVAVSFGDPYVGRALAHADVYVCAFVATARVERRVAAALRGAAPFVGRLPVGIPGAGSVGDGLTQLVGHDVPRGAAADHDLAPDLPDRLRDLLAAAVADGAFPGAVCAVARSGVQVAAVAVGGETYGPDAVPVSEDTRFDLASLTKVCATTPAVLALAARGALSLDDPVVRWVPAFRGGDKAAVTVRDLLAHRSGLPAWAPFHRTLAGRDAIVAAAAALPLSSAPGTEHRYSDVGFVLLGAIVEAASGEGLDAFAARTVFGPLGMQHAGYAPLAGAAVDAAPTEHDPVRGGLLRGRVHDENAYAMGGVAGHAGLFATAADVLRLGVAMLAGGRSVLPRDLVAAAIRPERGDPPQGLGFRRLEDGGFGGSQPPPGTFGHAGFTGTSLWCDPVHDLCVVLLTNRVHPTRDNGKIGAVRRALHDLVLGSLR